MLFFFLDLIMNAIYYTRTREQILDALKNTPITNGQFDPNGKCNAKCWFCPIKYEGNPKEYDTQLPLTDVEKILKNLRSSTKFPQNISFLYTAHYNEILLYKNFEELIGLFRKYNFTTMILTNGTPLTPSKLDFINKNRDVILGINFNIPAIEKVEWSTKAGFSETVYKTLLNNLEYTNANYTGATLQINCSYNSTNLQSNGMQTTEDRARVILKQFKQTFPNIGAYINASLSDRAGLLVEEKVLVSRNLIDKRDVVACTHSNREGGRVMSWVHINSKGELFLCCDDFKMDYTFGSLLEQPFDELWVSEKHIDAILKSRKEICTTCTYGVRG